MSRTQSFSDPTFQRRWDDGIACLRSGDGQGAIYIYKSLVADGCSTGLAQIGRIYEFGLGRVDQNFSEAVKWFKKSTETLDDLQSHLALARIYLQRPELDDVNRSLAVYHLRLLEQNNIAGGAYGLGLVHEYGLGTEVNANKAVVHYAKAVSAGHVMAQLHIARINFNERPLQKFFPLIVSILKVQYLKARRPYSHKLAMWDDDNETMPI